MSLISITIFPNFKNSYILIFQIYGTIFLNVIVIIAAIVLLIFSQDAISWYETCQYQYYASHTHLPLAKDCTDEDKSTGNKMYWVVFVTTLLVIPITVAMLILLAFSNSALMEEMCQGTCFRKMVYIAKGPDTQVSLFCPFYFL